MNSNLADIEPLQSSRLLENCCAVAWQKLVLVRPTRPIF